MGDKSKQVIKRYFTAYFRARLIGIGWNEPDCTRQGTAHSVSKKNGS